MPRELAASKPPAMLQTNRGRIARRRSRRIPSASKPKPSARIASSSVIWKSGNNHSAGAAPAGDQTNQQTDSPQKKRAIHGSDQGAALDVVHLALGQSRQGGGDLASDDGAAGLAARPAEPAGESAEEKADQPKGDGPAEGPGEQYERVVHGLPRDWRDDFFPALEPHGRISTHQHLLDHDHGRDVMSIKIRCPNCNKALSINESMAGKRAACPACKTVLTIPSPSPATAPAATAPVAAKAPPAPRPAAAKPPAAPRPAPKAAPAPETPPPEDIENLAASLLADEPKPETLEAPKTIDFDCPMCGEPIKMDVAMAGKQGPCPECKRIIKVPRLQAQQKLDWRNAPNKPTGARLDTEPEPEGAWGTATARGVVSRESLEEAGALPDTRDPVTVRQWIGRGMTATAVLVLLIGGTVFALSFFGAKKQEAALAKAMAAVTGKDATLKGPWAGIIHLQAARYHLNRNEKDSVSPEKGDKGARQQLTLARGKLAIGAAETANPERDALLIEVALAQLDMGGTAKAVDERRKLTWPEVRAEVLKTLQAIRPPEGKDAPEARIEAVRRVTRRLIELDQATLAEDLARQLGDGPVSAAVAGLEFLRAGNTEAATRLNTIVLSFYREEKPAPGEPKKVLPLLTVDVVALASALVSEKEVPLPTGVKQTEIAEIGKAAGLAALGRVEEGRVLARKLRTVSLRLEALIAVADAAKDEDEARRTAEEAVQVVKGKLGDQRISPWVLARLVRLGLANRLDEADLKAVAQFIHKDEPLRGWVELQLFRAHLARESGKVDESLADSVGSDYLSHGLARIELVRHNMLKDNSSADAVEQWKDPLKPFGYLGIALGLQNGK